MIIDIIVILKFRDSGVHLHHAIYSSTEKVWDKKINKDNYIIFFYSIDTILIYKYTNFYKYN